MRPDTKRHLNLGVQLLLGPGGPLSTSDLIELQRRLAAPEHGLLFDLVRRDGPHAVLVRTDPPLEVRLGPLSPLELQLQVAARRPLYRVDDFADEVESVVEAVQAAWPGLRIVWRRDATIAHLYAVSHGFSFPYLWVHRLGQAARSLDVLGRSVQGGGLRLVLAPDEAAPDGAHAEVRIESFFADQSQLFVEGYFEWRASTSLPDLDTRTMLAAVEAYLDTEVRSFVSAVAA